VCRESGTFSRLVADYSWKLGMDLRGLCKVADAMKGLSTRGAIFCAIQINGCAVLAVDGCFGGGGVRV
jgi:hypothetical protein